MERAAKNAKQILILKKGALSPRVFSTSSTTLKQTRTRLTSTLRPTTSRRSKQERVTLESSATLTASLTLARSSASRLSRHLQTSLYRSLRITTRRTAQMPNHLDGTRYQALMRSSTPISSSTAATQISRTSLISAGKSRCTK